VSPIICTMSDSGMFWYLRVFLDSLRETRTKADIVIGDLGMDPDQIETASQFGRIVKLNPQSVCVKADLLKIAARTPPVIYMDCDMLALTDPLAILDYVFAPIGAVVDPNDLETLVRYYFMDRKNHYRELLNLVHGSPERLHPLNSGLVVVQAGLEPLIAGWKAICSRLIHSNLPLLSLRHRKVSDQLAFILYTSTLPSLSVLGSEWNFAPVFKVDGVFYKQKRVRIVHYLSSARPDFHLLNEQSPAKIARDQSHPFIELWKDRARKIGGVR